ncbi:MAG: aminotransferase class III-fold pyridoxal phosphate-dependent enzyme, partial [Gemmatimonadetes bacterium]|nr:aminotransferase class III-fold pyridoxal phosphate-dependent enzyme [Gemmatimonadota bacterium]
LDRHKDDVACVILDAMPHRVGLVPADPEYVKALREWTLDHDTLLAFDEVITFRMEHGGFQERYHFCPDLTALGKMIGGGFPVGAIAGRADVMEVMNPLAHEIRFPHSGTFSANPVTMTAGLTAMRKFDREAVARMNHLSLRAVEGIRDALKDTGVPGCVTGGGSMFRVHFRPEPPRNHREAYRTDEQDRMLAIILDHLFESGFLVINTCTFTLSTPMGNDEIDALVAAMGEGFEKIKREMKL